MSLEHLNEYSTSFQIKVISNLLKDKEFLAQMFDALTDNLFESDANNFILGVIKTYYTDFKSAPSPEVFKNKIKEIENPVLRQSVVDNIKQVYTFMANADDLPYVQQEFEGFCKNQEVKNAFMEGVELFKSKNWEKIEARFQQAFKAFTKRDLGYVYEDENNIQDRLVRKPRLRVIPTEWEVINNIIDGGAGEGDLCILVGSAGSGKSWSLVSIGTHALKMGKNVVHFTLELNENYTSKRYDSKLTGIPSQDLKYHALEVQESIESNVKGRLRVFFHPTKTATINTLKRQLDGLITYGFQPDLIIVDYADLLRSDNIYHQKGGSYFEIGSIYEELRGLAGEYKVPVWSASQAHRSAADQEIITGEQIAESFKKVMTGDFVISVQRKVEDKLGGTARWHIIKNRYGPDGLTFPSKINAAIGTIEIFEPTTEKGANLNKEMNKGGELKRFHLKQKFDQIESDAKKNLDGFESSTTGSKEPNDEE